MESVCRGGVTCPNILMTHGNTHSEMGSTESTLASGYRVLNVQNGSPCDKGGLVAYFDFIMKANDIRLVSSQEPAPFKHVNVHVCSWRAFRARDGGGCKGVS